MRMMIAFLAVLVAATPAAAISRYKAWTMSCGEAKSLIRAEGAVILRYRSARNPSLSLYDRYVRDSRFCPAGEQAQYTTIPTADTAACPVRNCVQVDFDDDFFWLRRRH